MDEDNAIHCAIHCLQDWNSSWNLWKWHLLAHVCRRWRQIIFASARRLNLRIPCTWRTPVRKNLGIWPAFPIDVEFSLHSDVPHEDNILAAFKHLDRVCHVRLTLADSQVGKMVTVMQEPFPVLKCLYITSRYWCEGVTTLPTGFLGGSAPSLQAIGLRSIPYPALPTLLSSTRNLVKLDLMNIPKTGYISPKAMVASLAALPKLEIFVMEFQPYDSRPDRIGPFPVTRTILPALTYFVFRGINEYLEDFVGQIDGPRLNHISITTLYRPVGFQVAQLSRFIDHSVGSKLAQCKHAEVSFSHRFLYRTVTFNFSHRPDDAGQDRTTIISYEGIDWKATPMSQVLSQLPVTFSNVVHLRIKCSPEKYPSVYDSLGWSVEWLPLFRQFPNTQTLFVPSQVSGLVSMVLGHTTKVKMTEPLLSLELLCLEKHGPQNIYLDKFITARRHSDRPVIAVSTIEEFSERLESYMSKNE